MQKAVQQHEARTNEVPEAIPKTIIKQSFMGECMWQMDDFSIKRQKAKDKEQTAFCSSPCYPTIPGYRVCIKVYPNGDGAGHGTHLSVFFALAKGSFDDRVKWPFTGRVSLTLIDQSGAGNHKTTRLKPDGNTHSQECFNRPVLTTNRASGHPKFISLIEVEAGTRYNHGDSLFFTIKIDDVQRQLLPFPSRKLFN